MKTQTQTQRITELIESAKQQFGDFSEVKKQEIFLTVKEAKTRRLLWKQPPDRCLSQYVNVANHLLRSYGTDEFTAALNPNIDYIYVYVALVGTNTITVTAWRWSPRLSARNFPLIVGSRGMSRKTSGALRMNLA